MSQICFQKLRYKSQFLETNTYKCIMLFLDLEARPTDFQIEERFLRSAVDKFHARRYSQQCVSMEKLGFVFNKFYHV